MRISNLKVQRSFAVLLLIALAAVSAISAKPVAASTPTSFTYLAGSGGLCAISASLCPDVAMADNGDMISIAGSGTLSVSPKSATGSGTFVHMNSAGSVLASGTWTTTGLVSFVSYGPGIPQGFPNFFGGQARFTVTLFVGSTPVHTAILTVTCALGNPPGGAHEGIKLNVQDAINFNNAVSGGTTFIPPS